jgi:hypothetical protein
MNKLYTILSILLVFCSGISQSWAQSIIPMSRYEDSIHSLLKEIMIVKSDTQRIEINSRIENLFAEALKNGESFDYPFDSLKNISKLRSDDGFVRIINWDLPLDNGNFVYFGFIQHPDKKKKMLLFHLNDRSESISKPELKELSDKKWYGSLYYKILTNRSGKNTYYTLLGWDGNNDFTNKKIIEVITFSGNKVIFGPQIFKMEKSMQNRLIFEFAEQVKMMLRYDENLKIIVFDHLAPEQKKFEGDYMHYGPDLSQDGLKFEKGNWKYLPNLDLRNTQETKKRPINKSDKLTNQ